MKKYMLLIGSMVMISGSAALAMSGAQIAQAYEKGIENTFYPDYHDVNSFFYFLPDSMTPALVNWCNKAAADMKTYVRNHSKNLIGSKDSLLNNSATEFEKLHLDTINAIKLAKVVCLSDKPSREGLIQQYNIFAKQLNPRCSNLIARLNKENYTIADKKESKELLLRVLNTLQDLLILAQGGIKYVIDHPYKK